MSIFSQFHERLQEGIAGQLGWQSLRPVQEQASAAIMQGKNAIILAPTAGGKTEAAFFPVLSEILRDEKDGLQVLYIAPIKALLNNQAQRLARYTKMVSLSRCVWHGDIGASRRKKFLREPDTVLMTTPESLEVMQISRKVDHERLFKQLRFVIIDEIHALAGSDRGTHLRSVLHRIFRFCQHDVQRIGLSATVGNPEIMIKWLFNDSNREGMVINPPAPQAARQILVVHRDTDASLAMAVAKSARKQKSLFFCQSRALTEKIAEKMGEEDIETYVHHSSISKEGRDRAEQLFQQQQPACIVCTSTLELGIDIGDLDKVFQAEAPTTVSSFLQRMGRTGRRTGQTANTTFFCSTPEGILQSIALVELAKERWVESIEINQRSWAVLLHQILAICLAQEGESISALWSQLSAVPDFSGITEAEFYRLIGYMLKDESLVQLGGRLLLGPKAEKLFGKMNFMNLYAVFSSPQHYSVETMEKHPIGHLPQDFVDELYEESCFILGGQAWSVQAIRHSERLLQVIPAPKGKQPSWGGLLPHFLSFEICQKIKDILRSNETIPYLREKVADILQQQRHNAQISLDESAIIVEDGKQHWYTYAGGRINSTLKHALRVIGGWHVTANNFSVVVKNADAEELDYAIRKLKSAHFWSENKLWEVMIHSLPQYRLSKFQSLLPQWAVREMLADYLLDLKGTWRFLTGTLPSPKRKTTRETITKDITLPERPPEEQQPLIPTHIYVSRPF